VGRRAVLAALGLLIVLGTCVPLVTMAMVADANVRRNARNGTHLPETLWAVLRANPLGLALFAGLASLGCTSIVVACIARSEAGDDAG